MKNEATKPAESKWRRRLYEIIFEADTVAGKTFDVILLLMIILSVAVVILESVKNLREDYGKLLLGAEWAFTIVFTVEYVLRLMSVRRPLRYAKSFFAAAINKMAMKSRSPNIKFVS